MNGFDSALVGRRVREEREKSGLSLAQLAGLSGLTKAYLVRLENQGGNPTLDALAAIANALDITVADLIGAPRLTFVAEASDISASLRAYADEYNVSSADVRTLASIKWRKTDAPRTPERWKFIHDSLHASRTFDRDRVDVEDGQRDH